MSVSSWSRCLACALLSPSAASALRCRVGDGRSSCRRPVRQPPPAAAPWSPSWKPCCQKRSFLRISIEGGRVQKEVCSRRRRGKKLSASLKVTETPTLQSEITLATKTSVAQQVNWLKQTTHRSTMQKYSIDQLTDSLIATPFKRATNGLFFGTVSSLTRTQ